MTPRRKSSACSAWLLLAVLLLALGLLAVLVYVPVAAAGSFGPPVPALSPWQQFSYAVELLWNSEDLTLPRDLNGAEQLFVIEPGESVYAITERLEAAGLVRSGRSVRVYMVWTGMDAYIQTGTYRLSPALSGRSIADMLRSSLLTEIPFNVLAGWRMEEIAASLPTSGLAITPEQFLIAAAAPLVPPAFLPPGAGGEGYLAPGAYLLPRETSADQLVSVLFQQTATVISAEMQAGFSNHGLSLHQAVTLASMIEREAVHEDEMALIASVFYNRLAIGMKLQSDPTAQFALGYNAAQGTWWTNPLTAADLQVNSPYNTYVADGLPPGPICNPGLAALQAVAAPASSPYYYFQARCDGSGYHNFAETFEQHEQNYCP
jgi:UPF0755 protein